MLLDDPPRLRWLLRVLVLIGFTITLHGALTLYHSGLWTSLWTWRYSSLCLTGASLFLFTFIYGKKRRVIAVVALLLAIAALISSCLLGIPV
jgi:hypothetical protein